MQKWFIEVRPLFLQNFHKKVKIRNSKQQFFVGWATVNDVTEQAYANKLTSYSMKRQLNWLFTAKKSDCLTSISPNTDSQTFF